jgi:protein involved in polysaccharide export with SLBB domain
MKRLLPLLLAGCSTLVVPLYDEGPVLALHPGLRGRIVTAAAYRPGDPREVAEIWSEEDRTLAAGDRLRFRADDRDVAYAIAPDGAVDFPWIGRVACAGRKLLELRRDLEARLRDRLKDPRVSLAVSVPSGETAVTVVGMANTEGRIERTGTLHQILAFAGGVSRHACLAQILVVRDGVVVVCDYYRYATERDEKENLPLRAGDIVVVTELYDPDRVPCAAEWGPLERFLSGTLDRTELIKALHR